MTASLPSEGDDLDRSSLGGGADGVLDQVRERLQAAARIGDGAGGRLDPQHEVDAVVLCLMGVPGEGLVATSPRSVAISVTSNAAAAQPREVEQVADQALQPVRLALDHLAGALRRDDAVGEPLGVAADRGERRLQLVTDREQERALGVLGAVELLRQLVERRRELPQLGRALDRERHQGFRPPPAGGSPRRPA